MLFQKTLVLIALIALLIFLLFTGILLYNGKNQSFIEQVGNCPDYWEEQEINNEKICVNVKNLGNCPSENNKNFNIPQYKGKIGNCNKKRFADSCELTWDGITNNSEICKE